MVKASGHKIFGLVLVAGALLAAAAIQALGPGLVVTDRVSMTPQGPGPGGVMVERTSWYLVRLLPVAGVAVAGLACLLRPKRVDRD